MGVWVGRFDSQYIGSVNCYSVCLFIVLSTIEGGGRPRLAQGPRRPGGG